MSDRQDDTWTLKIPIEATVFVFALVAITLGLVLSVTLSWSFGAMTGGFGGRGVPAVPPDVVFPGDGGSDMPLPEGIIDPSSTIRSP